MPAQSLAAAAALVAFAVHGNRVELKLNQGAAEIGWITHSTFRFRHSLEGPLQPVTWPDKEKVQLSITETPAALTMMSKFLQVSIQKRGLLVKVLRHDGTPLANDLTDARMAGGRVVWERSAGQSDRFYGLGPQVEPSLDLRGRTIATSVPMLSLSSGYGEFHATPGSYTFDLARDKPDRYRIEAPAVDYYLAYGPTPKEIFEEVAVGRGPITPTQVAVVQTATWETLREQVLRMTHASMSGIVMPAFDISPYLKAPPALLERARQLGQITAGLTPEKAALTPLRRQLTAFFTTYGQEARDRAFPFFHPMPMQFPEDAEGARHADQFLLGDEMLVAPIYTPSGARDVYLPRGIWTNLETNEVHPGRRTIAVTSKSLPVFARNGTIVPLNGLRAGEPMLLHYFPSLGAEFFLLELAVADWTQVHAAPAADIMRFEIESKVERPYEWIAHHVPKPASVEFESKRYVEVKSLGALKNDAWFYDAATKNLHLRLFVKAGEDAIVNVISDF